MAKMKFDENVFSHDIMGDGKMVATLDLGAVFPTIVEQGGLALAALQFAIKTASRNATAGKLSEGKTGYNPTEAFENVKRRMDAWSKGVWQAASEASGESRTSLLARAVAEVMGITPEAAAEEITALVDAALDEKGLSRDEEDDKAEIRKVANAVKKTIREDVGVVKVYARLQAEEAAKRAEEAGKTEGESKLATLLKR